MARLAITFAVFFFLFTFSGAHLQVYSTENDVNNHDDSSKSLPDVVSNPTIFLPSDKSDQSADESATVEIEAVDVNDLVHVTLPEPRTFASFHPINRHFSTNRQFPLRFTRRRPCLHFVRPMNHRSRQISYGNDMILSNNENNGRDPELIFRDQIIPSMALRFQRENHRRQHHHHHHGRHQNEFISKYVFARDKLKRPARREDEEKEREMENGGTENGGFVKRFRKFLNHF